MIILLSDVVAHAESAGNRNAVRFEPVVFRKQKASFTLAHFITGTALSGDTARALGACSWGKFQIMGYNIYGVCGYQKTLAEYLVSDTDQLNTFIKFIAPRNNILFEKMLSNVADLNEFSRHYNGSVAYAETLKQSYQFLNNQKS